MKARPFILRCATVFLLFVFLQKSGGGLFLHNLLHTTNSSNEFPGKEKRQSNEINYACSCIDDYLMPFDEATKPTCLKVVSNHIIPATFFEDRIPFQTIILSSLRGPPAPTV